MPIDFCDDLMIWRCYGVVDDFLVDCPMPSLIISRTKVSFILVLCCWWAYFNALCCYHFLSLLFCCLLVVFIDLSATIALCYATCPSKRPKQEILANYLESLIDDRQVDITVQDFIQ